MKTVLIAGAGNFGCWWASSLCNDLLITSITLYDPFVNNLALVFERASILSTRDFSQIFTYVSEIDMLSHSYDLVVIASNSSQRFSIFVELYSRVFASFWVLEKVLSYSLDELDVYMKFSRNIPILVNHSRRLQPLWIQFKSLTSLPLPSKIIQRLGPWDLASNIFHFVDLISWLYSTSLVSISVRNSCWRQSEKRSAGYFDLDAVIELNYANGIYQVIERDMSFSDNSFEFYLDCSSKPFALVNEISGLASFQIGCEICQPFCDWSLLAFQFTSGLWKNKKMLPTFSAVYSNSKIILEGLREDWFLNSGKSMDEFRIS